MSEPLEYPKTEIYYLVARYDWKLRDKGGVSSHTVIAENPEDAVIIAYLLGLSGPYMGRKVREYARIELASPDMIKRRKKGHGGRIWSKNDLKEVDR